MFAGMAMGLVTIYNSWQLHVLKKEVHGNHKGLCDKYNGLKQHTAIGLENYSLKYDPSLRSFWRTM